MGRENTGHSSNNKKFIANHWQSFLASGRVLNSAGDIWFLNQESLDGYLISDGFKNPVGLETDEEWEAVRHWLRPVFVSIRVCENVWIGIVTFWNSPCWTIHLLSCENVLVTSVRIFNPEYFQGNDALDLESCNKALVAECLMDVGDNGLCVKSGKDADGRERGEPCQDVVIRNGSPTGVYNKCFSGLIWRFRPKVYFWEKRVCNNIPLYP